MHFLNLSRVISPLGSPSWSSQPAQILSFPGKHRKVNFSNFHWAPPTAMCQARQSEDLTEMRGVLSSQMQPRKAVAVLGEIVRTFGGYCAERLEAGELPGLTFALHSREAFQEEVVSHGRKCLSRHFPCAFYLNQPCLNHWRLLIQGGFWGPW